MGKTRREYCRRGGNLNKLIEMIRPSDQLWRMRQGVVFHLLSFLLLQRSVPPDIFKNILYRFSILRI